MKKIIVMCLSVLLLLGVGFGVFAEPGAFLESPSLNRAPRLISFRFVSEECEAVVAVTSYADRDRLAADGKAALEKVYDDVKTSDDLTKLNADLAKAAKTLGIPGEDLAVSDLFDISMTGCDDAEHEGHGYVTIKLEADTLKNFVGLLHFNNDKYELVANATAEGDVLTFQVDDFSPFAIVVDTNPNREEGPKTGEASNVVVYGILLIAAAAVVALSVKAKKVAQ